MATQAVPVIQQTSFPDAAQPMDKGRPGQPEQPRSTVTVLSVPDEIFSKSPALSCEMPRNARLLAPGAKRDGRERPGAPP